MHREEAAAAAMKMRDSARKLVPGFLKSQVGRLVLPTSPLCSLPAYRLSFAFLLPSSLPCLSPLYPLLPWILLLFLTSNLFICCLDFLFSWMPCCCCDLFSMDFLFVSFCLACIFFFRPIWVSLVRLKLNITMRRKWNLYSYLPSSESSLMIQLRMDILLKSLVWDGMAGLPLALSIWAADHTLVLVNEIMKGLHSDNCNSPSRDRDCCEWGFSYLHPSGNAPSCTLQCLRCTMIAFHSLLDFLSVMSWVIAWSDMQIELLLVPHIRVLRFPWIHDWPHTSSFRDSIVIRPRLFFAS